MLSRITRKGLAVAAATGLAAAGLTVLSAPAHAAGGATIQIDTTGNIGTGQTISVSGNAGGPGAPDLFVAVCEGTPTATNCDQSLSGAGTPTAHVLQVSPNAVTGAWGPVSYFVRTTIVTGHTPGGFNCISAGTCVIGTTNSMNPADHTYDSTTPLGPLGPTVTLSSSTGVDGDVVSLTGSGFPAANTTTGAALNTPLNIGLCGFPPTATSCDKALGDYAAATVDANGHVPATNVTLHFPFTDFGNGVHTCTAANSCIVGTSNAANNADQTNTAGAFIQNVPAATLSVASVTGQTVTTAARSGNTINVTGVNWASGAITAQLCDSSGANCDATGITSNTLAVDASGNLTGGAVVDASATGGVRSLKVTSGATSALAPITILGTPTVAGTPATGGTGTVVAISGSNWNPGSTVTLQGRTAVPGDSSDAPVTVTASGTGSITGSYTVNDPATTSIQATDGTFTANQAFSASALSCNVPTGGNCALTQNVHFLANPGLLNQAIAGTDVNLGTITLTGQPQSVSGSINQDVVTDARGTSAGWTLNASLTDLTNGATPTTHGTIPAANMAWTPNCKVTSGGATPTTGSSTNLSTTDQLFCSVPSGTGNGAYTADAGLSLTVPATADAGTYNAILTLTLS
jgi:hypothetical protein